MAARKGPSMGKEYGAAAQAKRDAMADPQRKKKKGPAPRKPLPGTMGGDSGGGRGSRGGMSSKGGASKGGKSGKH